MSEIAIIGIGAVNDSGIDINEIYKNMELSRDDPELLKQRKAINKWEQLSIPPRLMKKIDRFSALAIHVCQEILSAPKSSLNVEELKNTGIFIGNVYAGWSYALPYMEQLYKEKEVNYNALSPYIATSWFPTAAQGEVSILFQILGSSKTFCAGNLSSGYSITHGMDEIKEGGIEFAIAGGSEVFPAKLGEKYHVNIKQDATESAAFLLLQEAEKAANSGRKILCYIKRYCYANSYTDSMNGILSEEADRKIDAIIGSEIDEDEINFMKSASLYNDDIKIYDINAYYGKLYGSQIAMQIILAIYFMRQKASDQYKNVRIIVNSKDSNGIYLSILLALSNNVISH